MGKCISTLHIGSGTAPDGHAQDSKIREVQAGTEASTFSVRHPGDWAVKRPNTVFPVVPQFLLDQAPY